MMTSLARFPTSPHNLPHFVFKPSPRTLTRCSCCSSLNLGVRIQEHNEGQLDLRSLVQCFDTINRYIPTFDTIYRKSDFRYIEIFNTISNIIEQFLRRWLGSRPPYNPPHLVSMPLLTLTRWSCCSSLDLECAYRDTTRASWTSVASFNTSTRYISKI